MTPPAHTAATLAAATLAAALLAPTPAHAADRPTVVELFTAQGCSSCPPADALLTELARDPAILPLAFHVTYWDRLGWKDPYALPEATARQHATSPRFRLDDVYTPQMVIDGRQQVVGSDRTAVTQALARARTTAPTPVQLSLTAAPDGLALHVGAGSGTASILLVGFDPTHETPVHAGENSGRTLHETNVVRSLTPLAPWTGAAQTLTAPRPPGARFAALLQASDGSILAAALLPRLIPASAPAPATGSPPPRSAPPGPTSGSPADQTAPPPSPSP